VKPAVFQYRRPETLDEALALLNAHCGDAAVLAGGQSLMPMLNLRVAQPAILIDINQVPELDAIRCSENGTSIGARARHNDVLQSADIAARLPLLTQAMKHVAHEAIRNRGTFGGSLALADPAAELPACTVCLGGEIVALSVRGERRIASADFFEDVYTTALEADELIVRVSFPQFDPQWRFAFDEVARRRGDFAIAGLAMAMRCEDGIVVNARVASAGIEPASRRLSEVEKCFIGSDLNEPQIRARARAALCETLSPTEGGDFPSSYRIHIAGALLERLVERLSSGDHEEK
jgi:carbon-monoxide dehydrogenase medium subunit